MRQQDDPLNDTKRHEAEILIRVISCEFVDRFSASDEVIGI
jgi:hypothetical protein